MIVRYDDPEFSRRYDVTLANGTATVTAQRQAAAYAWNHEYAPSAAPLTKYVETDPHIIRMADLWARVVS